MSYYNEMCGTWRHNSCDYKRIYPTNITVPPNSAALFFFFFSVFALSHTHSLPVVRRFPTPLCTHVLQMLLRCCSASVLHQTPLLTRWAVLTLHDILFLSTLHRIDAPHNKLLARVAPANSSIKRPQLS